MMRSGIRALTALILAAVVSAATAQSITTHGAPRLSDPTGNLFFRLSGDGTKILINHSPQSEAEDLVMIPRDGVTEQLWIRCPGRRIYNRIAVSGNGNKVAFAYSPGSAVYVLHQARGIPKTIANVDPDGDVRQLVLSHDGGVAAFTASCFKEGGQLVRVRTNLYVAATDGTKLTKLTALPVFEKFIPFALAGDGNSITWVDDPKSGAWIADANGGNARRLPAAPDGRSIQNVFCNATGTKVYYQSVAADGVKLHVVDRASSSITLLHSSEHGFYEVPSTGSNFSICKVDSAPGTGGWWTWNGSELTREVTLAMPRHLGSWAWSADCGTLAWRGAAPEGGFATYVWRRSP